MNQFIKLYLVYPIFLIAASIFFLFSIEYIDSEKTKEVTVNTYDSCRGATDFKSCVLDKHEALSRFVNCVSRYEQDAREIGSTAYLIRTIEQGHLSGCYDGYEFPKDSLVHYERAAELINKPIVFKEFIKTPGKLCNAAILNKKYSELKYPLTIGDLRKGKTITWVDAHNRCDESGNPASNSRQYKFTHYQDRFLWNELLFFLLFFIPSSLILIFFWRNKKVINKLLKDQQTYSWLSNKKKFRTALVLSLGWLAFFFIVLFSNGDFSGFNPFNERQSFELWLVYLFSLYPLMTLLISYFIYSAEEN